MAAGPLIGTLIYFQVGDFWFANSKTVKVSSKVLVIDSQQMHHKHIWDKDDNTRQVEHDQLFPFSEKQTPNTIITKPEN